MAAKSEKSTDKSVEKAVAAAPDTKAKLEQVGVGVIGSSPEELRAHLAAEMAKWGARPVSGPPPSARTARAIASTTW